MSRMFSVWAAAVLLIAFWLLAAFAAGAQEPAPAFGPELGFEVSNELSAEDQSGSERSFEDLTGYAGLVVFFNRSVDWCPNCRAQAVRINDSASEFYDRGYGLAMVATDEVSEMASFVDRHAVSYPILADPNSQLIEAWNVLDPAFPEGHRNHGLPYPSTVVLSADGVVEAVLYAHEQIGEQRGYRTRLEVAEILAAIDALDAASAATAAAAE